MRASEQQRGGLPGFLRACRAAAWLEYRNLRYYPSNLVLAGVQELTAVGVWYFVGRFLNAGASHAVQQYGGNYLAYVVIGGRLGWQVLFSTCLQLLALLLLLLLGGVSLHVGVNWPLVVCAFLLLILSNAGLGVAGASLFFLLEVKSGQDPITWAYRYLVMLASGLYVPLSVLPAWLRGLSSILPQTYGLAAMRALVLTGASWDAPAVLGNLLPLAAATLLTLGAGYAMLSAALRRAERGSGIGVVV
jgi:ABC-2 type transport system permease protein